MAEAPPDPQARPGDAPPSDPLEEKLSRRLGDKSAKVFASGLGIETVGGLLRHFPRRYVERGELTAVDQLPVGEEASVVARVVSVVSRRMMNRKGVIADVLVDGADVDGAGLDAGGSGSMTLTFFNQYGLEKRLPVGAHALFSGKVTSYRGRTTLTNPDFQILPDDRDTDVRALSEAPMPLYPATAKLKTWVIQKSVALVLDTLGWGRGARGAGSSTGGPEPQPVEDPLPAEVRASRKLLDLATAYGSIHRPASAADWQAAQRRFRYQEAFLVQMALLRRKAENAQRPARPRPPVAGGLLERFDASLPYELTEGQRQVGAEIAADLAAEHPMNRLLQGDVGSGKTVVALRAMLSVVDNGGQAVLLAPTEVLAAQHFQSIVALLGPLASTGARATLLTGSLPTARKRGALLDIASGRAGIVVGTHALLSENVSFADLGLVVVDEQHRFGVEQRDRLRQRSESAPHVLVMTATPIPRTVAMTVFGDLEVSTLKGLPAARAPISTHVVNLTAHPAWRRRIVQRIAEEAGQGHQVYVVCPKIEPADSSPGAEDPVDDDPDGLFSLEDGSARQARSAADGEGAAERRPLANVEQVSQWLSRELAAAGVRVGALHGRMDPGEKDRSMADFTANRTQVLVSTTVVEVGVDVPNATMMAILDADRFGISQLHQLRGRVGRGGLPGLCLLVTNVEPPHPSMERLEAVAATTDGFELSVADLDQRREGDVLGASQSGGRSSLRLLRVADHQELIGQARADAAAVLERDPDLTEHPRLREELRRELDAEREAYLEKG